jgi:ribosomal protein L37AE/L43A
VEDRGTTRVTALLLAGVFIACFMLAAASMPQEIMMQRAVIPLCPQCKSEMRLERIEVFASSSWYVREIFACDRCGLQDSPLCAHEYFGPSTTESEDHG